MQSHSATGSDFPFRALLDDYGAPARVAQYAVPAAFVALVQVRDWPEDVELDVDCGFGAPALAGIRHLPKKDFFPHPEHGATTWRGRLLGAPATFRRDELLRECLARAAFPGATPPSARFEAMGSHSDEVYKMLREHRQRTTHDELLAFACEWVKLRNSSKDIRTDNGGLEYMRIHPTPGLPRSESAMRRLLKRCRELQLLS